MKDFTLEEFNLSTPSDWEKEARESLRGKPFESLFSDTYEDIVIKPIYFKEDIEILTHVENDFPGFYPFVRGRKASGYKSDKWLIAQPTPANNPEEFNKIIKKDLTRGQNAILIIPDRNSIHTLKDLETALEGVEISNLPVFIEAGLHSFSSFALLLSFCKKFNIFAKDITGAVDFDPLGNLLETGTLPYDLKTAYNLMATSTQFAVKNAPRLLTITINAGNYHEAGANAVQELAFAVSTGVEYIREMVKRNIPPELIADNIRFTYSIGPDFFMEIAKLRAARLIWAKILKSFGIAEEQQSINIHAKTTETNKSRLDQYVNMLRITGEALAAIIGGCDSLETGFFTPNAKNVDEFTRRIARNTQIVLSEECGLTTTADPAGGSWYIESLTDSLARRAWSLFQEIEKKGGMSLAILDGYPQELVENIAKNKMNNFLSGKEVLVGTNKFTNPNEKITNNESQAIPPVVKEPENLPDEILNNLKNSRSDCEKLLEMAIEAILSGATIESLTNALTDSASIGVSIKKLNKIRFAEPFEQSENKISEK